MELSLIIKYFILRKQVIVKVKPVIPTQKEMEPLLEMDRDEKKLGKREIKLIFLKNNDRVKKYCLGKTKKKLNCFFVKNKLKIYFFLVAFFG